MWCCSIPPRVCVRVCVMVWKQVDKCHWESRFVVAPFLIAHRMDCRAPFLNYVYINFYQLCEDRCGIYLSGWSVGSLFLSVHVNRSSFSYLQMGGSYKSCFFPNEHFCSLLITFVFGYLELEESEILTWPQHVGADGLFTAYSITWQTANHSKCDVSNHSCL